MQQQTTFDPDTAAGQVPHDLTLQTVLSIVIPMKDEVDNVTPLLDGCAAAATPLVPFEICVTDDGSTDGTDQALDAWAHANPEVRVVVVTHPTSAGQSCAVHNAVRAAQGQIVVTLDGDGQNPPDQIPALVAPLLSKSASPTVGLVAGQRVKRDDPVAKRWASKAANTLRGALLKDATRDTGCGLKAFRRDAFLALPYFNHMHRFLPALFQRDGWDVAHVDVAHRARTAGQSKYTNLQRALVGAVDLLGTAWLIRRRKRVQGGQVRVHRPGAPS